MNRENKRKDVYKRQLLEPEITIEGEMTNETIIELEKLAEVL